MLTRPWSSLRSAWRTYRETLRRQREPGYCRLCLNPVERDLPLCGPCHLESSAAP